MSGFTDASKLGLSAKSSNKQRARGSSKKSGNSGDSPRRRDGTESDGGSVSKDGGESEAQSSPFSRRASMNKPTRSRSNSVSVVKKLILDADLKKLDVRSILEQSFLNNYGYFDTDVKK